MLNVLEGLIPAKYRKYVVYILIPLVVLAYGVWQAVDGDWTAFWPALVPALIGWLVAAPNTHPEGSLRVSPFDSADQPGLDRLPVSPTPDQALMAIENADGTYDDEDYPVEDEEA